MILPLLSIPDDDSLVAKTSPRGPGGDVMWTGYYARGNEATGEVPASNPPGKVPMVYLMVHWRSTKRDYRLIEEVKVTNVYCGVGSGWDVIVLGDIVAHHDYKTEAQGDAEKLLDGRM
jgi:hypothetical protein